MAKPKQPRKVTCPGCRQKIDVLWIPGKWTWSKHVKKDGSPCPFSGQRLG